MKLSENALKVLEKRYFKKDQDGNTIEDWQSLIARVASNIAGGDDHARNKYEALLDSGCFLPNSPTLMNAGSDLQQLSACFVLPIEDSMESIFETIKNAALIHKSGGGTGFSFSRLREADAPVRSTNGVSSGPISFLKVFNAATDAVKQGGTRRGANMAMLDITHPQVIDFITCKEDTTELTNFNISVAINDAFMQAVHQDSEYELVSPNTGEVIKKVSARDVFSLIVEMAHKNGEPGVIFLDRINQQNPTPHIGRIESTNPCGEQPLLPNEACNLGSINLAAFVKDAAFDYDACKKIVRDSVEFLDHVIDRSNFPLPEIQEMVEANRKIGLGVMGWADLLYQLEIPYNSDEAIELAKEIMEFIDYHGKLKSVELAVERGSFPNYKESIFDKKQVIRSGNLDWDSLIDKMAKDGMRNATVTTIAPTGTISMICDTSSGIEPQFSLVFVKNVMDGEKLLYVNPYLKKALENAGIASQELMEKIADAGSVAHIEEIPEDIRRIYVTSHDITPEWHIKMQAAFQKYTDNAVSKTINFKREATREDVQMAFELAWELGCKGVTVYRDGSRENQVLNVGKKEAKPSSDKARIAPRNRPEVTRGFTQRIETGCGHMYVTINSDEKGACELFTQMGKVGGCASAQLEAIARLVSLCLRSNVKVESITRQLKGIRCPSPMWYKGKVISSCADGVATALETSLQEIEAVQLQGSEKQEPLAQDRPKMYRTCPDCGGNIEYAEGCMKCPACGWSKC